MVTCIHFLGIMHSKRIKLNRDKCVFATKERMFRVLANSYHWDPSLSWIANPIFHKLSNSTYKYSHKWHFVVNLSVCIVAFTTFTTSRLLQELDRIHLADAALRHWGFQDFSIICQFVNKFKLWLLSFVKFFFEDNINCCSTMVLSLSERTLRQALWSQLPHLRQLWTSQLPRFLQALVLSKSILILSH